MWSRRLERKQGELSTRLRRAYHQWLAVASRIVQRGRDRILTNIIMFLAFISSSDFFFPSGVLVGGLLPVNI